jgi:hypothetical protein
VHLPWFERSTTILKSEAGFRTDRQAVMHIDTRLDFMDMDITHTVTIGPQTDELVGYWHL